MVSWYTTRCLFVLWYFALWASSGVGALAQVRLLSEHPAERPARLDREWPAVLTHTHNWRFHEGETAGSFPATEEQLVQWCRDLSAVSRAPPLADEPPKWLIEASTPR
jgi:hypothetical protein